MRRSAASGRWGRAAPQRPRAGSPPDSCRAAAQRPWSSSPVSSAPSVSHQPLHQAPLAPGIQLRQCAQRRGQRRKFSPPASSTRAARARAWRPCPNSTHRARVTSAKQGKRARASRPVRPINRQRLPNAGQRWPGRNA